MPKLPDGTAWKRYGKRGAPTVVLIHGFGLNRAVWQWMIPALEDSYDIIAYDIFGHGESAPPPDTPSLSLFSRQLQNVLKAAEVEEAAIAGFSLGGMIARRFAMDHPDRCRALVILHSQHLRSPEAQAAIEARVGQAEKEGPEATVAAALERWFTADFRERNPEMMALVRGWVVSNDKAVYPAIYNVLARGVTEIAGPTPPLRLPALVLTADEDFGNDPEMTRAIAAEIEGSEVLVLPGLRHMALAEDPGAVNAPVRAFLDRVLIP